MTPKRIQRKRTKGWRMPEGVLYVGRPSVWGNHWTVDDAITWGVPPGKRQAWLVDQFSTSLTPEWNRGLLGWSEQAILTKIRTELAGHDLACWCPLDQPCHADVLLEIANQP